MSSAPGLRGDQTDTGVYSAPRPPQLPYSISIGEQGVTTARLDGGGRESATVVAIRRSTVGILPINVSKSLKRQAPSPS